jgi:hypothetical protein
LWSYSPQGGALLTLGYPMQPFQGKKLGEASKAHGKCEFTEFSACCPGNEYRRKMLKQFFALQILLFAG